MEPYLPVWKQYFSGAYRTYPLFHRAWGYVTRGGSGETVLVLRTHSPLIPLHATSLVFYRISFFFNISFGCLKNKIRKVLSEDRSFCPVFFFHKKLSLQHKGVVKETFFHS